MTKRLSLLALCAALPALAQSQDLSLMVSQFTPRDFKYTTQTFSVDKPMGYGLRYAHDVTQLWGGRLAVEGSWMLRTSGKDIKMNGVAYPGLSYRHEYMGLGASLTWTKGVDFGTALELRHEGNALRLEEPGGPSLETTRDFTRPWLSARVAYTFASVALKPHVGLEIAAPLASKTDDSIASYGPFGEALLGQDLNPKFQISLVGGIRF
ncbi:MAG TPA: hypothetical protein VF768_08290 [Holophagaceae bacterium]